MQVRRLVLDIREKVEEYHEALIRYKQVLSLTSPERRALKATRNVFAKDNNWKNASETMIIDGLSKHLSENEQDLCALRKLPEPDRLTRLFEGKLAFLFRVRVRISIEDK
ncbi:hypothetical protein SLS58_010168 [Diplodia intermedia]|uniref:DUF6594 domain-containing protein n=1 Tax=Diplodia intermedia TaxID=856260 RepID=A0ABR3T7Z5_9PEZI